MMCCREFSDEGGTVTLIFLFSALACSSSSSRKARVCILLFASSETADDFKFLELVMNAFVPCKFAAHFLQIPHVNIVLVESIVRYLFAFFQLWSVDNFNDMTD